MGDNGPVGEAGGGAPAAAGQHLPWAEVPAPVRAWAERAAGSTVLETRDATGGFSPGCCTVLSLRGGRTVFVKAVGSALNPHSPRMHRREARVAAALPRAAPLPVLLDTFDDGDWIALLYEGIAGALPATPWREDDLTAVLDGLADLHEALTPCPIEAIEPASVREAHLFSGWRSLAEAAELPDGLDEWSRRHLDRLAATEPACLAAIDDGDTLLHGDIRSDNVLLGQAGPVFIDWPHASRGAPVRDLVGWAPSVALEGGPEPAELLARFRPAAGTDPDAVTAILAGVAGFFTAQALGPPEPGLPGLRPFQDAQGVAARAWLRERTGWN